MRRWVVGVAATVVAVCCAVLLSAWFAHAPGRGSVPPPAARGAQSEGPAASTPEAVLPPASGEPGRPERIPATPRPRPPVTGVAVAFSPGVTAARRDEAAARIGFRIVREIPQIGWTAVEPTGRGVSARDLATTLARSGLARAAHPEVLFEPMDTPSDPLFAEQWGYRNTGQTGGTPGADANAVPAWDWARGDGVVVAVTDTGVDFSRPDLAGKQDPWSWDYYHNDATVFDPADGDKHGTHVAGTIAATTDNSVGGAGMSRNTRIMALKFIGPYGGTDTNAAAAIVRAVDHGARVINASWGGTAFSQVLLDAINYAASRGVLMVCAAGNAGYNNDVTPIYPASYAATNVIAVAALDHNDAMPAFSDWGPTSVDIGAPGLGILSTQPKLPGALLVDKPPYKVVYLAFPVEGITAPAARQAVIGRSMSALATSTSSPVMVIDDSWPTIAGEAVDSRLAAYTDALAAAGYSNVTTYSVQVSGTPSSTVMAGRTVVWFTGATSIRYTAYRNAYAYTLSSAERMQVALFLSNGGRLLMSSGDLGYDMNWIGTTASLSFYSTYFGASLAADDPWTASIAGTPGGLLDGVSLSVRDPWRYGDGCDDVVAADASSTPMADWSDYATISGTSMATPHVTGAAALAWSRTPSLGATALRDRILATARPVASLAGKTVSGGRLDVAAVVGTMSAPAPLLAGPGGTGTVRLAWTNPADSYFAATRVLSRVGTDPVGPTDASATVVYEGGSSAATQTGLAPGAEVHFAAFSRNAFGFWSDGARVTTVVVDPPMPGAPIPVGSNVRVTVSGVTLVFSSVSAPGWLSITRIAPSKRPPANFLWTAGGYYEIHPVGGVFALPVDIEVPYDPAVVGSPASQLRFFHDAGGEWQDVTVSVDTTSAAITARTASFSEFGVAQPAGAGTLTAVSAESPWTGPVLAACVAGAIAWSRRRRPA